MVDFNKLLNEEKKKEAANTVTDKLNAYRHYTECGIIVHPICPVVTDDSVYAGKAPGKSPIPMAWSERVEPYPENYILQEIEKGCNLGILCGKASDVTVLDIDWYRKGIVQDYMFKDIDVDRLVKQVHGDKSSGKGHMIFRFNPKVLPGINQDLGFDVLTQHLSKGGSNCVCSPSIHMDGTQYRLNRDIAERPVMPDVLAERINTLVELYSSFLGVLARCRKPFRMLWKEMFSDKHSEIYHDNTVFRGEGGRNRHLSFFAELKANGADDEMLMLCCMLIFGNDFDLAKSKKEFRYINPTPAKKETIAADPYLSKYYVLSSFDPFTASIVDLEKRLDIDSREIYENMLLDVPFESFESVQRAFLVGYSLR